MPIANGYVPCQMNVSNQMVCLEWHHWQFITYMFAENGPCLEQCAVFENLFEQNILINPNYGMYSHRPYESNYRKYSEDYQRPEYRNIYRSSSFRSRNENEGRSYSQGSYRNFDRPNDNATSTSRSFSKNDEEPTVNQVKAAESEKPRKPDYSNMRCYGCRKLGHPISECTERLETYKSASKEFRRREDDKSKQVSKVEEKIPPWKEELVAMLENCESQLTEAELDYQAQDNSTLTQLHEEVNSLPNDVVPSGEYLDYVALRVSQISENY